MTSFCMSRITNGAVMFSLYLAATIEHTVHRRLSTITITTKVHTARRTGELAAHQYPTDLQRLAERKRRSGIDSADSQN